MQIKDISELLKATGLPVAYRRFRRNEAPNPPFIIFYEEGANNFAADGIVYSTSTEYTIELYTDKKDPASEKLIEDACDGAYIFWTKNESYIEEERFFQIRYEIEV